MAAKKTCKLAFDVYGTLIDPSGAGDLLTEIMGDCADAFNDLWRSKQLEYSFRRGLMDLYVDFSTCTEDALDYTCEATRQALSADQRASLLARYTTLPAYPDAETGLKKTAAQGHRCFAFSNGSKKAVEELLRKAGLSAYFEGIVSAEDVRTFKPDPEVYAHFCRKAGAEKSEAVLISANPFDVIGAKAYGMRAVWVRRNAETVYDSWGAAPDAVVKDLDGIGEVIREVIGGVL